MWSHAAVPNSISSGSRVWTQGAGGRPGTCSWARPPRLVPNLLPKLCGSSLQWSAVPFVPCGTLMSYWQPHNSGKGVSWGGRADCAEGPCSAPPPRAFSPCSLFEVRLQSHPAGTRQPHSRLRAGVSASEPLQASEPTERPLLNLQNFS